MTTTTTLETLKIVRLALFQLRQDVGVPESVEDAATDQSVTWVKCRECFDIAFGEVFSAHNWTWKRNATEGDAVESKPDNWGEDAKNALIYCVARELAVPIAGRTEDMKNLHSLYQEKLRVARIHDLEFEIASIKDPDVKEVLSQVCPTVMSTDSSLPMDLLTILRRIESVSASAKAEILAAHNWSFARDIIPVTSVFCDDRDPIYHYFVSLPAKCSRVLECYDRNGNGADWKIVGTEVRSIEPITAICYIRDDERTDKWNPLVRTAYISLIASDIALTVARSSAEAQRQRELYERNLQSAKLADSRSTGSRKEVYGENFYAKAMRGGHNSIRGCVRWR